MQASKEWSNRPEDQRFTSLYDLQDFKRNQRRRSAGKVVSSRHLQAIPSDNPGDHKSLYIEGPNGIPVEPTNWAFGQLSQLAGAPASYLRTLPAPMAADCLNYGLKYERDISDIGVLVEADETGTTKYLRAATGPRYGRIWDYDIVDSLVHKFGDGVTGQWTVPGEFGKSLDVVTKANTTLFASDRDMFVFLADEHNRIELPNRRDGKPGQLSRGFFVWNSEVGDKTIGAAFFLFDYVCANRIVWGAEQYKEIRLRHTVSAPDKWLEEISPVLIEYSNSAASTVENHLRQAQESKVDNVTEFLTKRYGKAKASQYEAAFEREEGKPMESLWDITTGMTAYAKTLNNTDNRVDVEREAGKVLAMAG
jgi:hypothetical protein